MEGLIHLSATDYAVLRRSVAVLANCDLGDRQPRYLCEVERRVLQRYNAT